MNEQEIIQSFRDYLKGKGFSKKSLSLQILPDLFLSYYQEIKFDGFCDADDGDMLLFQYGIYGREKKEYFQLNFTRQFYEVFEVDSHQIYQLGVTFFYEPQNFEDIAPFNKWSAGCLNLNEFKSIMVNSAGYERALEKQPVKQEINLDLV